MSTEPMNCERVAELLPWLLNGTLDEPTRDAMDTHVAACPHCQRERSDTDFALDAFGRHVTPEELVEYAFGRPIDRADTETIESHLASCDACRDQLALVRESRNLMAIEGETRTPAIAPVAWHARLRSSIPLPLAAGLVLATLIGSWTWTRREALVSEARLAEYRQGAGQVAGLEAELQQQRRRLADAGAELRQQHDRATSERAALESRLNALAVPQADVPVVEIYPIALAERDGRRQINDIDLSPAAASVTLILNAQARSSSTRYGLDLVDGQGRIVWGARGVTRRAADEYTLTLPAALIPPGLYRIDIYGDQTRTTFRTETYQIRIRSVSAGRR